MDVHQNHKTVVYKLIKLSLFLIWTEYRKSIFIELQFPNGNLIMNFFFYKHSLHNMYST